MKKYLLTAILENTEVDKMIVVKSIVDLLHPLVDSPQVKFQYSKDSVILYFESDVDKEEVYDFITGVLLDLTETYILTQIDDKNSVMMPPQMKAHLLDLEIEPTIFDFDDSENAEEFIENFLYEFKKEIKQPTLNEILDKILDKGITSLSNFEKETLELYSKN